jgi:hypothetical protein
VFALASADVHRTSAFDIFESHTAQNKKHHPERVMLFVAKDYLNGAKLR